MAEYRTQNTGDPDFGFEQMLKTALDTFSSHLWTSMPGIVQRFDPVKQFVDVIPALRQEYEKEDGTIGKRNMPVLINVPVQFPSGGGYTLTYPLKDGDPGLIVFSDRCIDNFKLSGGGVQNQAVRRAHDLSDGIFIPGVHPSQAAVTGFNTSAVELRTASGDTKISIEDSGKVTVKGSTEVKLEAPVFKFNELDMGVHIHRDAEGRPTTPPQ